MGEILNLVGLSTGIVLYAMLLAMVVRAGRSSPHPRIDPLLLVTALLGLVWNVNALPTYELPKLGLAGPFPWPDALGLSALGFLPAVVVHSVLRDRTAGGRGLAGRVIVGVAYATSMIAALLQVGHAALGQPVPSAAGMTLLTYAYGALIVPLAVVSRGQSGSRRAVWIAALGIFAISGIHLSQREGNSAWPVELLGHHASIPLALAILYQDFPFALADLFLKRALSLLALVAVTFASIVLVAARSNTFAQFVRADPQMVGLLVTAWLGTALLYPRMRRWTSEFVDTIVLKRPDYQRLRTDVAAQLDTHEEAESLLTDVCGVLAQRLGAERATWAERQTLAGAQALAAGTIVERDQVCALVPTSDAPDFVLTVSKLTGGRRFLSDDLLTIEAIALGIGRRIDGLRITAERHTRELREQQVGRLAREAELRALRAQVNPHFLFNALTTIGHLIQTGPERAFQTLMRLTTILRAALRTDATETTLGEELDLVEAYLEIERERFDERLQVTIDVPSELRVIPVPPFVLQPLVENAIKHGVAPQRLGGRVIIRATIASETERGPQLLLIVEDTGPGTTREALARGRNQGVGLRNIEGRLNAHYGAAASLHLGLTAGQGVVAEVRLPIGERLIPKMLAGVNG